MYFRIPMIFAVILLSGGVVFAGEELLLRSRSRSKWIISVALILASVFLLVLQPDSWIVSNLVLLLAATVFGVALGGLLPSVAAIWAFLLAASIADVLSFGWGFTSATIEAYAAGSSELLRFLSISIPSGAQLQPVVGGGDLVILAVIFSTLRRMKVRRQVAYLVPMAGLIAAAILGMAIGGIFAVPFIAAGTAILLLVHEPRATPSA